MSTTDFVLLELFGKIDPLLETETGISDHKCHYGHKHDASIIYSSNSCKPNKMDVMGM